RNLTTFVNVAESGSFSRAAQLLGYSQPTVSVQIRQREEELGFRLFDRIGHAVRLTDQGRDALAYAQQVCRLCQQMSQKPGEEQTAALIRLATSDSLCAPLIGGGLAALQEKYPQISLQVTTAGTDQLFDLLDHNEADIVCTLDSHIYNTNYIIAEEEQVGVHMVCSVNNPLAAEEEPTLEQLLTQPFLLTEKGMSYRRLLDEMLAQHSLEITPVLENGRADILCALVERDMGVSFLPDFVTEDAVRRGTVKRLRIPGFAPELWKQLLYHRDKWVSPQMKVVMEQLATVLLAEQ
ncbi:MAG: LysR family transcriptional regulator, partial [Oscillospiraceae bacterium]|nr:LysR family transcriptional regulator [Oscillospiraceae bacterium]